MITCPINMRKTSFRELLVWKKAKDLSRDIYKLTEEFPGSQRFALISQLQRAALSIPSNIAEGHGRGSVKEFIHFLYISLGSCQEVETLVIIAHELGYIESEDIWIGRVQEINKMLNGLIRSLKPE